MLGRPGVALNRPPGAASPSASAHDPSTSATAANSSKPRRGKTMTDEFVSLERWQQLDAAAKHALLHPDARLVGKPRRFNPQEGADIEWARWSWNPITGCLHDCP